MPKAIFQAAYTLLAFSPFPDKDNYFSCDSAPFPTKITIFHVKFLISDNFLMCAQASSAFIRVLNMAATVLS